MSNVPTPTRPGKADTILTFTIKDESRADGHALSVRYRSVARLVSRRVSCPSAAMRTRMNFCKNTIGAEQL